MRCIVWMQRNFNDGATDAELIPKRINMRSLKRWGFSFRVSLACETMDHDYNKIQNLSTKIKSNQLGDKSM